MAPFRAILFDVYGTLLDVHGLAKTADTLFPGLGVNISREWRRKQLEYCWLRTMAGKHADFGQVTADALDYIAQDLDLDLDNSRRVLLLSAYDTLPAFADALPLLTALRHGQTPLAALSNGSPAMLGAALAHAGIAPLLDDILSVEQVGRFKVAPEVYQLAVDRFGAQPRDLLLVSSNGWDCAGAAMFGLSSFWVNREGAPVERLGVDPRGIGRTLDDLLPWLRG